MSLNKLLVYNHLYMTNWLDAATAADGDAATRAGSAPGND